MYSLPFEEEINSYQRHENISTLNLIKFILPVAKFFTAQSFSSNWCYFYLFCYTVKPLLSGHPLLSGQKPKSPNLFPLFTLNETFIKLTETPKQYLKWSFLLLSSCIRTLEIKLHQPTGARHQKCGRLPRIITPKFFDFYIKKRDLTNFFD